MDFITSIYSSLTTTLFFGYVIGSLFIITPLYLYTRFYEWFTNKTSYFNKKGNLFEKLLWILFAIYFVGFFFYSIFYVFIVR